MSALADGIQVEQPAAAAPRTPGRHDPRLLWGLAIVGGIAGLALFAPRLAPYNPHAFPAAPLAAPSIRHLLGANDTGQDLFSQLLYGARASLVVGLLVGFASTLIAWLFGLLSGFSRRADGLINFIIDLTLLVPPLPAVILIAAYLGGSTNVLVVTLSAMGWAAFARVVRGQVQVELRGSHVEAARSLGASSTDILLRHVAPATVSLAIVTFVFTVQYAVVAQASLAFLGLGDPGTISWGGMVHRAAQSPTVFLTQAWLWWLLPPALAIAVLVAGCALIGWGLERRMSLVTV